MSTKNADRRIMRLNWQEAEGIVRHLASMLQGNPLGKLFAVSRGGLVPATMLAHYLGIRRIELIQAESYGPDKEQGALSLQMPVNVIYSRNALIVDDIVATGNTFRAIRSSLAHPDVADFTFATMVIQKRSEAMPWTVWGSIVDEEVWTSFPWEAE